MNDINACIGLANIINVDSILQRCRLNGEYFNKNLKGVPGIQLFNIPNSATPSYWIYTLKILGGRKTEFITFMKNKNIITSQVHARNDVHTCLKNYKTDLKNLNIIEKEIISIPVGWWVNDDNLKYIVSCIKEFASYFKIAKLGKDEFDKYSELVFQMNNFKGEKILLTDQVINDSNPDYCQDQLQQILNAFIFCIEATVAL
jgi:hypothetical protein